MHDMSNPRMEFKKNAHEQNERSHYVHWNQIHFNRWNDVLWSQPRLEHAFRRAHRHHPKGLPACGCLPAESTTKPAGHAIIGMGITYQGYPLYFDCGNDAGLAVAGLNFPGYAQYEVAPVQGKTNVAAYEFPAWITSNFSTVDEVEEALGSVAIIGKPVSESLGVSLLHWIIGDAKRSIVVEYLPTE